ncbi:MAG: signal recognition particle-docking protein FtsY [Planctomycetota bacterium]
MWNPFKAFAQGLAKTREKIASGLSAILPIGRGVDEKVLEELELLLIGADLGPAFASSALEEVKRAWKRREAQDAEGLKRLLAARIRKSLGAAPAPLFVPASKPAVYLFVGVNGTGKTTTIGKLAARMRDEGKKVLLGAADTFRAAAIEQLEIWAKRAGADIVRHQAGSDPSAVAFDACEAAKARGVDALLLDTAGRLQTKQDLMQELNKIRRVVTGRIPEAPHETLLVLDATTGQNGVSQAILFKEVVPLTGIVLTKLDGTAKGGIVVRIREEAGVPVKLVGLGEGIEDLADFDPVRFADALVGLEEPGPPA